MLPEVVSGRDLRGAARFESIVRDLRFAIRSLTSRPAFTLTVVATLALGIGANAAIFTLVDALLLRPLPVSHPEQLVIVSDPAQVNTNTVGAPITDYVSFLLYKDVRARNTVFTDMYATGWSGPIDVQIGSGAGATAEQPHARFVTGNFFSLLGVPAYAGRTFTAAEDETPGQDPVVVLSYDYWQSRFSGSPAAIGSVMRINDVSMTIIGVTPPGFRGDIVGQPLDFWLPMMMDPAIQPHMNLLNDRTWSWVVMMGRLKPGVTLEQARQQVSAVEANAIRENLSGAAVSQFDDGLKGNPIHVVSGARGFSERRGEYAKALWVLMAAVGLVILVVCANVSSLMLSRAVARTREMTVRMTLGAGRNRLIQQLLVEGALLAIVSSVLGLVAALWGARALLATVGGSSPVAVDTMLDARVLAFTAALTLACVLLFGLLPAFRATRVDLATSLRSQGRNLMGAARVGARTVRARARRGADRVVDAPAHRRRLAPAQHAATPARRHRSGSRSRRCRARADGALASMSGRASVNSGATSRTASAEYRVWMRSRSPITDCSVGASPAVASTCRGSFRKRIRSAVVSLDQVGPNYFHAIGARLIRGRDIESRDLETGPPAVVINETMAKQYFGARDPLGGTVTLADTLHYSGRRGRAGFSKQQRPRQRRVARCTSCSTIRTTGNAGQAKLAVHVRGDPSRFVEPIRRAIEDVDPTRPIAVDPVNDLVRGTVSQDVLLDAGDDVLLHRHVGARGTWFVRSDGVFDEPAHQRVRIARGAWRGAGRA